MMMQLVKFLNICYISASAAILTFPTSISLPSKVIVMTKFMATMITHDDDDDDNDNDDDDEEANTPQTAALLPCNVAGHPTPSIRSFIIVIIVVAIDIIIAPRIIPLTIMLR